jgi:hypothetical protein
MIPGGRLAPPTGSTALGFHADAPSERTSLAPEAQRGARPVGVGHGPPPTGPQAAIPGQLGTPRVPPAGVRPRRALAALRRRR